MPFRTNRELKYFIFNSFEDENIGHGIYTRHGGYSSEPWKSLNLGGTVGDSDEIVIKNKRLIFQTIERPVESIFDVWQVHSADIVTSDQPRDVSIPYIKADGIITDKKEITLLMRFADCVPVLLYDPGKKVVGLVHAGWQGTIKEVAKFAIQKMYEHYQCNPEDIKAGIGPSIGPDHFEVGSEVIGLAKGTFKERANEIIIKKEKSYFLNLWKANQITLENSGVRQIEIAGICTACHTQDWYSHRAEQGKTGRFGAVIYLK